MKKLFIYKVVVRHWKEEEEPYNGMFYPTDHLFFVISKNSKQARKKIKTGLLKNYPTFKDPSIIECQRYEEGSIFM